MWGHAEQLLCQSGEPLWVPAHRDRQACHLPAWTSLHDSHTEQAPIGTGALFPESVEGWLACLPCFRRCFPSPGHKDLKMVPSLFLSLSLSLSPSSLSSFLSLSLSQMAILLTAAKKMLHSTVHMCPEMFIELFELQPCPHPQAEDLFFLR